MKLSLWMSAAALAVAATSALGGAATSKTASAAGGAYYTAAQAKTGQVAYNASCASCHGANLEGVKAPALSGPGMKGSQTVADIYGFMVQQMPAGAPGSLTPVQYTTIMAYVLQKNGHPAGAKPLTAASVKAIKAKI
ncbi:MAG: hypothetical protein NVS3B17_22620 [Vulcanimicrobiaceae bacterium]